MYAMLGDVGFELLNSFTSLEAEHAATFAKHEVLQGKPRLQAMGNDLSTLRFSLKLHWKLGNVDKAFHGLIAAKESQQAQALVYGSGRFVGWFVIERLSERTLIQDANGRTAARELDVELTEFVGDPNNPLPTPAVMQAGKNPLLALLPESVQAQASGVMQAVEKGVQIYRAAEDGIGQMLELVEAAKDLKNDPSGVLNMVGDALGIGGAVTEKLSALPQIAEVMGDLKGASEFFAQTSQAASRLGSAAGSLRSGYESGSVGEWLSAADDALASANDSLLAGAAAAETLTGYLASRRDL